MSNLTVSAPSGTTGNLNTDDMIFVFGSNEQGKHNGGAALAANRNKGAEYHVGFGKKGKSFALPTCSRSTSEPNFEISPETLRYYIYCFILFAKMVQAGEFANSSDPIPADTKFQVTRIGTGLAGWTDAVVAPLFAAAPDNCYFDLAWKDILGDSRNYWGTYGQLVPAGGVTAPVAAAPDASVATSDPLSLTAGN